MIPGRELPHLKAITLWRPYSDAIVDGVKPVENRTWAPYENVVGTYIAIHGGRKYDDDALAWPHGWKPPPFCAIGIVGVVRLAGVLDLRGARRKVMLPHVGPALTTEEREQLEHLDEDPWWAGPVGWFVTEPVRIEPVDVKGALGIWKVPMVAANSVRERWTAARAA